MSDNQIRLAEQKKIDTEVYQRIDWEFEVVVIGNVWKILHIWAERFGGSNFNVYEKIRSYLNINMVSATNCAWFDYGKCLRRYQRAVMTENLKDYLMADNAAVRAGLPHLPGYSCVWYIEEHWWTVCVMEAPRTVILDCERNEDVPRTVKLIRSYERGDQRYNRAGFFAELTVRSGSPQELFSFCRDFFGAMNRPFSTGLDEFTD